MGLLTWAVLQDVITVLEVLAKDFYGVSAIHLLLHEMKPIKTGSSYITYHKCTILKHKLHVFP